MGKITIFYKYAKVKYPKQVVKEQKALCSKLNLTGRILIAHEGINGTLAGSDESIHEYVSAMNHNEIFDNMDFKFAEGDNSNFPKLYVAIRDEIVNLGVSPEKVTTKDTGEHLSPEEIHKLLLENPEDLIILDTRNNYEWAIGAFKNAIKPDINTFREFPEFIDKNLEKFKDKQVLMYCTAGVRCERATAYLNQKNTSKKVYQIKGGIQRYIEKYPDGFFRGKNYVFDSRIAVKINDDILGKCLICEKACDDYTNCLNSLCNKHYITCKSCIKNTQNCCSEKCQNLVASKQVKPRPPLQKKI